MSIKLSDIGSAIQSALVASSSIKSACITAYGEAHSVYYGATGLRSPSQSGSPEFVIIPKLRDLSPQSGPSKSWAIDVGISVKDETLTTTTVSGVVSSVYRGPTSIETLAELAIPVILGISRNVTFDTCAIEVMNTEEMFPVFAAIIHLGITAPNLIGVEVSL